MLLPILSCGCLSGAGFLYVGIRARRLNWSIAGVVYSLLSISAGIWGSSVPPEALASYLAFILALIVWLASIVHALVINNQWLRWRAGYQPWYAQQPAAPWAGAPAPAPLPPEVQGLVPPPQQYYGAQPPADAAPPPTPPDVPLDVNSATVEQLAALPGVGPERAAHAVSARDSRGGFVSLTEFAAAASLAPHEFVAVRGRLTCAPPPVTPQQDHDQPFGRIVDV
ncbi:ComEA family DNA-binding protein [Actinoplanes campanulatus]|uniref:ComEA family DNA-binding protein n=1 Tax=Actinoplanes campanulatus TaxID=113559 RepID=UPI001953D044|nr:helix-hairpin-helix domain-containing protein [Actinoplanes capillaceus]